MRVISVRNKIREVAREWAEHHRTYGYHESVVETLGKVNAEICRRLAEIDPETATAGEVVAIMGNERWVRPEKCHECDGVFDAVIEIGAERDAYDSATTCVCLGCLERAVAALHTGDSRDRAGTAEQKQTGKDQ
jgi:hypothetical protein